MQVSVIVDNYNYGSFLSDAIDSALNQTYPDVEVIVVDDGSTDDSRQIIEGYGNRIVPILKENGGQGTCFNAGFARSSGDVIVFLDSDDCLYEDAVALFVEKLRDPNVSKCNGYLDIVDTRGRKTGKTVPKRLSPPGDYLEASLSNGPGCYTPCFTSGNAWSRRFLEKIFPIPIENRRLGSDGYLVAVDALFGRIEVIDRAIGAYRVHGSNHFPTTRKFNAENLSGLLDNMSERMRYLAFWAERLGYRVDPEKWRLGNWRLLLAAYALWCFDRTANCPSLVELIASPFRRTGRSFWNSLKISANLALLRLLPKAVAMEIARRLLRFSRA